MMNVLVLVLLGVTAASAAFSNATISTINLNETASFTMTPVPPCSEDPACYDNEFYHRVWIPSNASSLLIDLTNTNSACTLYYYLRSHGFVGPYSINNQPYYAGVTTTAYQLYNTQYTIVIEPGFLTSSTPVVEFTPGDWFYFGVGRYYSSDAPEACSYSVLAYATYCPDFTVPVQFPSSVAGVCQPYVTVPQSSNSSSWQGSITDQTAVWYKLPALPNTVSDVVFTIDSTSNYLYIYSQTQTTPASNSYHAYTSSSSSSSGSYLYSLTAATPRGGDYWILVYEYYGDSFNASVSIITTVCGSTGGYQCNHRLSSYNPDAPEALGTVLLLPNEYFYWYVDIAPYTSRVINSSIYVSSGYVNYFARFNGFPTYSSGGLETSYQYYSSVSDFASWLLIPQDTYAGGRYYFAIQNNWSNNATVSFSYASPSSSSTGSTGSIGTTGITGAATGVSSGVATGVSSGVATGVTGAVNATTATTGVRATTGSVTGSATATTATTGVKATTGATTASVPGTTGVPATGSTGDSSSSLIILPSVLLFAAAFLIVLAI